MNFWGEMGRGQVGCTEEQQMELSYQALFLRHRILGNNVGKRQML